jgi:hypothetical protein
MKLKPCRGTIGARYGVRREYVPVGSTAAVLAADDPVTRSDRPFGEVIIERNVGSMG